MIPWLKSNWFGLALLGLLVLALPAFALFGLNLLGHETAINDWLESRWQLGYHLQLPSWLAGLVFLVPPLLILLYFLKLKRKPLAVPSTYLWKKSIEDLHVNSLFQWLRQNLLLLLQLLAVLGLLYALLAPRFHGTGGQGKHYILMIDNSASMSATDLDGSRLEQARLEALREVDAAGDDDFGMVIVFNSSAEIRQSYTSNRHLLRQAIRAVAPTQRPTRIEEALSLADSLANPTRSTENEAAKPADPEPGKERVYVPTEGIPTEVHLFSDGRFPDVPEFALGRLELRYHAIGAAGSSDNVGIVNFNAVRDESDPAKLQLFARLLNFRPTEASVQFQVEVRSAGRLQKIYSPRAIRIPPRAERRGADNAPASGSLSNPPGEIGVPVELNDFDERAETVVRVRLLDHKDHFPLDDEAWLVVGVVRKTRVLLVSPGNPILDAFFNDQSTREVCHLTRIAPADLKDPSLYLDPARAGDFDLVIFDRCAPAREDQLPRGNTVFIGSAPPPWSLAGNNPQAEQRLEKVQNPAIKGWAGNHGLLRYLSGLHEIGISEAFRLTGLPPRTPRLIEGDQDLGLLLSLSRGAYSDYVLAFPLLTDAGEWNTNWPLNPSFPLFWRNVLFTLGNIRDASSEENTQPGQVKAIRAEGRVEKITVIDPGGQRAELERGSRAEFSFSSPERVGVYRVETPEGERRFAVNLLDAEESRITPRPEVRIGSETVQTQQSRRQPRELWKIAVLAGLVFLLLEWYVYNRRVFV